MNNIGHHISITSTSDELHRQHIYSQREHCYSIRDSGFTIEPVSTTDLLSGRTVVADLGSTLNELYRSERGCNLEGATEVSGPCAFLALCSVSVRLTNFFYIRSERIGEAGHAC